MFDSKITVSTPCRRLCKLDRDGYCQGCGRTVEEIMNWLHLSEPERLKIMATLPERLEDMQKKRAG